MPFNPGIAANIYAITDEIMTSLPGFARSSIRCVGVSVRNICVGRSGDAAAHNSHKGNKHSQGKQPSS